MQIDRAAQANPYILIMEKRLARIFPRGRKNKAMYKEALRSPIYVEEAPSRRAKRVMITPTSKFHEMALNILK